MTTLASVCQSEQAAVRTLGYTPTTWDNVSGDELQPWSSIKSWAQLTIEEKAAGRVLGYTAATWDNDSNNEAQPASAEKDWSGLRSCPDGEVLLRPCMLCLYFRFISMPWF